MSDLISRQEAIGGICDYSENMSVEYKVFADAAKRMLLNLPSVNCSEKPNNWIPVTERLPEEDEPVLVTRKFLGIDRRDEYLKPSTYVEIATRIDDKWFAYSDDYKVARSRHTDPIAWMPLPEPYETETGMQTSIETGMEREKG